jgi:hypothetical protein
MKVLMDKFADLTSVHSPEIANTESSDSKWYDMSGRRIDDVPTAPGLYIVNGRKVLVR